MDRMRLELHRRRGATRGSVFLLAMVALVVLLLLGTSLVQTAVHGLAWASDDRREMEAFTLAEAGVDMAITKLYEDYDNINDTIGSGSPYTDTFSLTQGTVAYTVTAPYNGISESCMIVSDATTWANRQARIRVVAAYQADVSGGRKPSLRGGDLLGQPAGTERRRRDLPRRERRRRRHLRQRRHHLQRDFVHDDPGWLDLHDRHSELGAAGGAGDPRVPRRGTPDDACH